MRVLHLNYTDNGGTGIAVNRFNRELNKKIISKLFVSKKTSQDNNVETFYDFKFYLGKLLRPKISYIYKSFAFDRKFTSTPAILKSRWLKKINESNFDIINLHWVNSEMISIEEIGKINKKICWTFHDMWPFCGGENISFDDRYSTGYIKDNKFRGFDFNSWMWGRKKKNWSNIKNIISPSHNHKELIKKSKLFYDANIEVIHNGIDLDLWSKKNLDNKNKNKKKINILYVYSWGEIIKGLDLFQQIILHLKKLNNQSFNIILCGLIPNKIILFLNENNISYELYKNITNENELIKIYEIADFTIITSRAETLPNVGVESLAMELPIIAFDETGSIDLVENNKNGFLIKKFDTIDFSKKINELIINSSLRTAFSKYSNIKKNNFCIKKNSQKYISFYESL